MTVSHRFMKVRLTTAVTGGTAPELSNLSAYLLSNYAADLTVLTGDITQGTPVTPVTYTFTATDPGSNLGTIPNDTLRSDYGLVYTADDDLIRIKINVTLTDEGIPKPFTDLPVSFHKQLEPGHSYTLLVTFRKFSTTFAASNIYWKGNYLTFDAVPNGNNTRYQGVFFKFGSLVGVSPVGSNMAAKVYVPNYNSGISPYWDDSETISTSEFGNWNGIPRETEEGSGGRASTLLNDDAQNTAAKWNAYTGDICRYISENGYGPGGKWRMPRSEEFLASGNWTRSSNGWGDISAISTLTDGKYLIADYATFTNDGNIFPASGFRNYSSGNLFFVGNTGRYWSSSAYSTAEGYYLRFDSGYVGPDGHGDRQSGCAVRCVLQE
jgi:hypothetical protein